MSELRIAGAAAEIAKNGRRGCANCGERLQEANSIACCLQGLSTANLPTGYFAERAKGPAIAVGLFSGWVSGFWLEAPGGKVD